MKKWAVFLFVVVDVAALVLSGSVMASPPSTNEAKAKIAAVGGAKNIKATEAGKLLKSNKQIAILDVRTPEEYAEGHIAGAKNLNLFDPEFKSKLAALDKDKPYLVHCASGNRSARVRDMMQAMHFTKIYHMQDGFNAWRKAGEPIVKGPEPEPASQTAK